MPVGENVFVDPVTGMGGDLSYVEVALVREGAVIAIFPHFNDAYVRSRVGDLIECRRAFGKPALFDVRADTSPANPFGHAPIRVA